MKKRISASLLLICMLAATACGGTAAGNDTLPSDTSSSETVIEEGYAFPDFDGQGKTFTILNGSNTWNFYTTMLPEEATGETLDDAIYDRNREIEEKLNIKFAVEEADFYAKLQERYQASILSGDYEFDAAFIPTINMEVFITEGYLYNLLDYPEFCLDKPYYDQAVNAAARVGSDDVQYFASNYISLSGIDGILCIFFNETMMDTLNMNEPYQLVRDGKWTLDEFGKQLKVSANLNGDENFTWNEGGNSTYGLASWKDGFGAFITGAGVNFVSLDEKNQPQFKVEERLYSVLDKIDTILLGDGTFISQNDSGNGHYEMIFKNGRSLFLLAELKASSKYRDMNDSFGIVPLPKYDLEQKDYSSYRSRYELLMSVPVTNPDPARAGIIMDAMAALSYTDVLPVYYDYRVSQKQLRNDDSIEMLDIIRSTMNFDTGFPFGWTFSLYTVLSNAIAEKSGGYASTIATYETSIKTKINETMKLLNDN